MVLKLASQTDLRCLWMDECTASNNSSLNEKKTWLIIETSETQAEIEVEGSAGCRPAWGGVCVLWGGGGRAQEMWRVGGWRLGWGPGSTVSPQRDHVGSLWLHDTVVGTLWILHHPSYKWFCIKKKKKRITGLPQPAKICSTQKEAHNLAATSWVKQNRSQGCPVLSWEMA